MKATDEKFMVTSERPEFETVWVFGADCGNNNTSAILKAHDLCNQYGMDIISVGNTIGMCMEMFEKGYLTEKEIGTGLVIFLGIEVVDSREDIEWLSGKISRLRIFNDQKGVMNLSVLDVGGSLMVVSQFTLHASTRKGNRPSYLKAAPPEIAIPLYEEFIKQVEQDTSKASVCGEFGAHMKIRLTNDGPVTILIDTKNKE
jgi:D-tyrosyl-tRNA(Tyr) deacylase